MKTKNTFVIGAAGFLGRNVSRFFSQKGYKVFGIGPGDWKKDYMDWGITKWYNSKVDYNLLAGIGVIPDRIIHCAGGGSVSESFYDPAKDFDANVNSLSPVLEFIRLKAPKAKLFYPSSVAVYGDKGKAPIKENAETTPVSPYGYHKKIAEELLKSYSDNFGIKVSIVRFFSIYGNGLNKQLMWDTCEKIRLGKTGFYGTGMETRDWLHIDDAVRLADKLSTSGKKFQIVNGASGIAVKTKSIIKMLAKYYGKDFEPVFSGKKRPGDPAHYSADISKLSRTGFKPGKILEQGIGEYVEYYKSQK